MRTFLALLSLAAALYGTSYAGIIRQNVTGLSKTGSTLLIGDVTLSGSNGITLTQSGQNIDISVGVTSLTGTVTGVLPIANGGTNSSLALSNGHVMVSQAGKIVEGGSTYYSGGSSGALTVGAPLTNGSITGTADFATYYNSSVVAPAFNYEGNITNYYLISSAAQNASQIRYGFANEINFDTVTSTAYAGVYYGLTNLAVATHGNMSGGLIAEQNVARQDNGSSAFLSLASEMTSINFGAGETQLAIAGSADSAWATGVGNNPHHASLLMLGDTTYLGYGAIASGSTVSNTADAIFVPAGAVTASGTLANQYVINSLDTSPSKFAGKITAANYIDNGLTVNRAVVSDGANQLTSSTTTATEIGYMNGVTSSVQTQLNTKLSKSLTNTHIFVGNVGNVAADVAMNGDATIGNTGAITLSASGVIAGAYTNATITVNAKGLVTGASSGTPSSSGGSEKYAINNQSGTFYTLAITDGYNNGNFPLLSMSLPTIEGVTIPANASIPFPVGDRVMITQQGAGQVMITPAAGVTLNAYNSANIISHQFGLVQLFKTATNIWTMVGDIGLSLMSATAVNGTITIDPTDPNYKIVTFLTSGSLTVTSGSGTVQSLVVAGGGGGGAGNGVANGQGGGGGAGGMLYTTPGASFGVGTYTVTVGSGGTGGPNSNPATNGGSSVFNILTATGGGAGGGASGDNGSNGGSGGGAAHNGGASVGTGTAGQGNAGGLANGTGATNNGGGGGGSGSVGAAASSSVAGAGGTGTSNSINGVATFYASGGGGGSTTPNAAGTASTGGGGSGTSAIGGTGTAGSPNTGGGGGGGENGGNGGSGIVILRYKFQ